MLPRVLIFAVLLLKEVLPAEGASPAGMEMERDPEPGTCEPELKFLQSQVSPCPVGGGLPETKELSSKRGQSGERSRRRPPSPPERGDRGGATGASEVAGVRSALRASDRAALIPPAALIPLNPPALSSTPRALTPILSLRHLSRRPGVIPYGAPLSEPSMLLTLPGAFWNKHQLAIRSTTSSSPATLAQT
jgi:hypothetical protein